VVVGGLHPNGTVKFRRLNPTHNDISAQDNILSLAKYNISYRFHYIPELNGYVIKLPSSSCAET
jgi:hypothetical protein